MNLPGKSDAVWKNLLDGTIDIKFEYMALNLLLFNEKNRMRKDPDYMDTAVQNTYDFFQKNIEIPKVQQAIQRIIEAKQ